MSDARSRLREIHQQRSKEEVAATTTFSLKKKRSRQEQKAEEDHVEQPVGIEEESDDGHPEQHEDTVSSPQFGGGVQEDTLLSRPLPTQVQRIMRHDIDPNAYGLKPDVTTLQIYNYEVSQFLTSFSKMNKKNGGNAITRSQLIEVICDVMYYDLGLRPDGFSSPQEIRRFIQNRIKKNGEN